MVLISHDDWQNALGGASDVLARSLRIDDRACRILAVLPPGFAGVHGDVQLWLPMRGPDILTADVLEQRTQRWHDAIGRLAPGVSLRQVQAALDRVAARLAAAYADTNRDRGAMVQALRTELMGAQGAAVQAVLLGVLLLMLITLLNLGGLTWVQASTRQLELALRGTLGANHRELALTAGWRGLCCGALAALLALGLTALLLPHLPHWLPLNLSPFVPLRLDGSVVGLVLLTGVSSGWLTQSGGHWLAAPQRSSLNVGAPGWRRNRV